MFSFDAGKPIAIIKNGPFDGEILFVDSNDKKCCGGCSYKCSRSPCCEDCDLCYDKMILPRDIGIEGNFQHIPNELERIIYIAGPQGSGKSTYASKYIDMYLKIFPNAKFFVFSRLKEDPAIDHLKPHRITIDNSLIEEPIDITEDVVPDTIILFDDIDTIQDKKLQLAVNKLKADILEIGRHQNIRCVITSHLINPNERSASRTLLNEMQTLTIFPNAGSTYQIEYALKKYFGFSTKQIRAVLDMKNTRWITLFKNYPQVILTEHRAVFVTDLLNPVPM
jgi:hypothetical protein